jgi:hypothetical protein
VSIQNRPRTIVWIGACALVLSCLGLTPMRAQAPQPAGPVSEPVRTFVERNCQSCHNSAFPSGSVDLQQMVSSTDSLTNERVTWDAVVSALQSGYMPPPEATKPPQAAITAVLAAISTELANAKPAALPAPPPPAPPTHDWLTFSYDGERTGWNRAENKLNKSNVSGLSLLWRLQTDAKPSTINRYSSMTDPVVVHGVQTPQGVKSLVYVASADNDVYAIDADRGVVVWKKSFPYTVPPPIPATNNCPNNLNATPFVDKANGIIYVLPNDGKLRGLALGDGAEKFPATRILPHYTRNFSLNVINGMLYTGATRGCGGAVSEIVSIDLASPEHPVYHFYTSMGKGSGPWGRGGIVKYPYGAITQTADGPYDPLAGRWGDSVLGFNRSLAMLDSYTPANELELSSRDLDLGSSNPVVFPFDKWTLVATSAKEGVIYLMDALHLGGADHRTPLYISPRWSNDGVKLSYNGMWSVMTTFVDAQGQRWLLAPFYGPAAKDTAGMFKINHGPTVNGTLMAFKVVLKNEMPALEPVWMSADMDLPGVAVAANGLIYIIASGDRGATLINRGGGPGGAGAAAQGGGRSAGPSAGAPPAGPAAGGAPAGAGRGVAAAADDEDSGAPLAAAGGRGGGAGRGAGGGGRGAGAGRGGGGGAPTTPIIPGYEKDAQWSSDQRRPFDQGGQQGGSRFNGGNDSLHAVLQVLDPATGDVLYSSGETIDSWNHYGGVALSDGRIYMSSYDARVYALGLPAGK